MKFIRLAPVLFILGSLLPSILIAQELKRDTLIVPSEALRTPLPVGKLIVSPLYEFRRQMNSTLFIPSDTGTNHFPSYLKKVFDFSLSDRTWTERKLAERSYLSSRRRSAQLSLSDIKRDTPLTWESLLETAARLGYDYANEKYNSRNLSEIDYLHLPLNTGQFRTFDDVRNEALQRGKR